MNGPATPDVLEAPLSAWHSEATEYLAASWPGCVQIASGSAWVYLGDREYQATTPLVLTPDAEAMLRRLPSYADLDIAVSDSEVLGPTLGKLVGTSRAARLFTAWTLAKAALPRVVDLINGRAPSFHDRYQIIRDQLADQAIDYLTLCPLQGIEFLGSPIELAPGIRIERLSAHEICTALEVSAIPTLWPHRFDAVESKSFALKKTVRVPVTVRDPGQADASTSPAAGHDPFICLAKAYEDVVMLQQCLALKTGDRIEISSTVTVAQGGGYLGTDNGIQSHVLSPQWHHGDDVSFGRADCRELQEIWRALTGEDIRQNKALTLAVRRLAFATQRSMLEDRLLDVFIAAEALYRGELSGSRERHRPGGQLVERAAAWSAGTVSDWSTEDVEQQMRRGYHLRNAVAHGDEPCAKDLMVRDQPSDLGATIGAVETIVRAGLLKAIQGR